VEIRSIIPISVQHTGSNILCVLADCHKKRRVKDLNKKIKKYMEEIHKTEKKIADLQQYLKGLHAALKQEEDNEMIKSIRGMKLDSHALHDLLNGIQDGTVKFQVSQESEEEGTGSFVFTEKKEEEKQYGEMEETE